MALPDLNTVAAVRLEILKVLVPNASRHSLATDEILQTARKLENYVVEFASEKSDSGDQPDPLARETLSLPRKDKPDEAIPAFMTPPQVDKSSKNRR